MLKNFCFIPINYHLWIFHGNNYSSSLENSKMSVFASLVSQLLFIKHFKPFFFKIFVSFLLKYCLMG